MGKISRLRLLPKQDAETDICRVNADELAVLCDAETCGCGKKSSEGRSPEGRVVKSGLKKTR